MKIVSWNINSIRIRLEMVKTWIHNHKPDVILFQETKVQDHDFPREFFEDLGYNIAVFGQKSYNGVAILSKFPIEDVEINLGGEPLHEARYIEAVTANIRVASVYVPNGQTVGSDKFTWKLAFLDRLYQHLKQRMAWGEAFVIGGDYNIAPTDLDVYDPKGWHEEVLCTTVEREAFRRLLNLGYYNAIRARYPTSSPTEPLYSWWDYRQGSFQKNRGLLIDHLLLSPQALDRLEDTGIEKEVRSHDKPSDHAPVWITIKNT